MRQANNLFTVARGSAPTDLLVTADVLVLPGSPRRRAGIMELTGNNTYSGNTIINAGTLKLSGQPRR